MTSHNNIGGTINQYGYRILDVDGEKKAEHIVIAEAAINRRLPRGAHVHHLDYNSLNNANANLVICPSAAYHRLLHIRTDALNKCGNANWRKCVYCKQYDSIDNLARHQGETFNHRACDAARHRKDYRP